MLNKLTVSQIKYNKKFFDDVMPIKLTEARRVRKNTEGWGILTEYYLESVKITWCKNGVQSAATFKVGDRSGQVVCVVRGPSVGILFGLSPKEWQAVESLCGVRQQLFYRYFKDGLSQNFGHEQRLFYNFCLTNQKTDVLVAVFRRGVNTRKKDIKHAFLEIIELRKCENHILDLYISHLRKGTEKTGCHRSD